MISSENIRLLNECIKNNWHCCIKREEIDDNQYHSIPVQISKELLLFRYIYDFEFDGYKIIRLEDITYVRHDEQEIFSEMIFRKEHIVQTKNIPKINLDNMKSIFQNLIHKDVIIECEILEQNTFLIGKIESVTDKTVDILNFDGVGCLDDIPTTVNYSDITCITIDSRYQNVITKYVK